MRLTKTAINEATYQHGGKHLQIIWDASLPSFGVRLYATGKKSYVVKFKRFKKDVIDTVAPVHLMPLEEAREKARRFLIKAYEERSSVLSVVKEKTVPEFCDEYMERHAKLNKDSWKDDERRCEQILKVKWGNLTWSSLQRSDVAFLLDQIVLETREAILKKTPHDPEAAQLRGNAKANRVKEQISVMFNCSQLWGYVDPNRANICKGIKKFLEIPRDRNYSNEEIAGINEALAVESNIYARAAIIVIMNTSLRKKECLRMKWDQVDLTARVIRIPRKVRKGKKVSIELRLNDQAFAAIKELPKLPNNPYVFCGKKPGKPLYDLKTQWQRTRAAAELKDARIHDLRHTVGACLHEEDVDIFTIQQIMGHADIKSTLRYVHHRNKNKINAALDAHGHKIAGMIK